MCNNIGWNHKIFLRNLYCDRISDSDSWLQSVTTLFFTQPSCPVYLLSKLLYCLIMSSVQMMNFKIIVSHVCLWEQCSHDYFNWVPLSIFKMFTFDIGKYLIWIANIQKLLHLFKNWCNITFRYDLFFFFQTLNPEWNEEFLFRVCILYY